MKKVNKNKIAIVSLLFLIVLIELLALGLSNAEKTKEINLKVVDSEQKIEDYSFKIDAYNSGESGYYITLPETVNNVLVKSYFVTKKEINTKENSSVENKVQENTLAANIVETNETNATNENIQSENTVTQNIINENLNTNNIVNTIVENTKEEIVTLHAGDRVFLTQDELENAEIVIKIEYDSKKINGETLYNHRIKLDADKKFTLWLQGYLPDTVEIKEEKIDDETGKKIAQEINQEESTIEEAYKVSFKEEYKNTEDNEIFMVLNGFETNKQYKIFKILADNSIEEITEIIKLEDTIFFSNDKLESFIITTDIEKNENQDLTNMQVLLPKLLASNGLIGTQMLSLWGGEVSDGFKIGDGSESFPYLISTGDELAYLAEQVNAGNTYSGIYFQLAADIDLNGKNWTPIGSASNSFRGIFDGAGHTIANGVISITNTNNNVEDYGFFGTIGGGNTQTIIRNIEFNNIKIDFNVTRTISSNSYGYKIGVVTGAIYNNSEITNVSVKNSQIIHNGTITAAYSSGWGSTTYYAPILFVGGIAGDAVYSSSNESNTGTYSIDYCFSDVDISLNVTTNNTGWGWGTTTPILCLGQINIGGIIGRIKSQNTWPTNSLYTGTITASSTDNANGLVGPIFGADRNTTGYNSTTNMNNIWNGDNKNSYTMNSYYNTYNVYGTVFTSTVNSGDAPANTQYRKSTSNSNIGYVQGVNKGIYTNSISTRLDTFNQSNQNVSWEYKNNELSLIPRISVTATETEENVYSIEIDDKYNTGTYTYTWYINGQKDDSITGSTGPTLPANFDTGYDVQVVVYDGTYYGIASYYIPKLYVDIEFTINKNNDSVTAKLVRNSITLCKFRRLYISMVYVRHYR